MASKREGFTSPLEKTQSTIEHLVINLSKSNEARRRLAEDVNCLKNQLDEMAASVVKNKLRIGELEATNDYLHARLRESNSTHVVENLRMQLKNEVKEKLQMQSDLEIYKQTCEDLTNSNIYLQQELAKLQESTPALVTLVPCGVGDAASSEVTEAATAEPSPFVEDVGEITLLRNTLENLKAGFSSREKFLRSEVDTRGKVIRALRLCLLEAREAMKSVAVDLCDRMAEAEELAHVDERAEVDSFVDLQLRALGPGSGPGPHSEALLMLDADSDSMPPEDSVGRRYDEDDGAGRIDREAEVDLLVKIPMTSHSDSLSSSGKPLALEKSPVVTLTGGEKDEPGAGEEYGSTLPRAPEKERATGAGSPALPPQGRAGSVSNDEDAGQGTGAGEAAVHVAESVNPKYAEQIRELEELVNLLEDELKEAQTGQEGLRRENCDIRESLSKQSELTEQLGSLTSRAGDLEELVELLEGELKLAKAREGELWKENRLLKGSQDTAAPHTSSTGYGGQDLWAALEEERERRRTEAKAANEHSSALLQQIYEVTSERNALQEHANDFLTELKAKEAETESLGQRVRVLEGELQAARASSTALQEEVISLRKKEVELSSRTGTPFNIRSSDREGASDESKPSLGPSASTATATATTTGTTPGPAVGGAPPAMFSAAHWRAQLFAVEEKLVATEREQCVVQSERDGLRVLLEKQNNDLQHTKQKLVDTEQALRETERSGEATVEKLNWLISQLEEKCMAFKEEQSRDRVQITLLTSANKALEDRRVEWSVELFNLKTQVESGAQTKEQITALTRDKQALENQLAGVKIECSSRFREVEVLQAQNVELMEMVSKATSDTVALRTQLDASVSKEHLKSLGIKFRNIQQEHKRVLQEMDVLKGHNLTLMSSVSASSSETVQLKSQLDAMVPVLAAKMSLEKDLSDVKTSFAKVSKDQEMLHEQNLQLIGLVAQLTTECDSFKSRVQAREAEISAHAETLHVCRRELDRSKDEIGKLNDEIGKLKDDLADSKSLCTDYEMLITDLRERLRSMELDSATAQTALASKTEAECAFSEVTAALTVSEMLNKELQKELAKVCDELSVYQMRSAQADSKIAELNEEIANCQLQLRAASECKAETPSSPRTSIDTLQFSLESTYDDETRLRSENSSTDTDAKADTISTSLETEQLKEEVKVLLDAKKKLEENSVALNDKVLALTRERSDLEALSRNAVPGPDNKGHGDDLGLDGGSQELHVVTLSQRIIDLQRNEISLRDELAELTRKHRRDLETTRGRVDEVEAVEPLLRNRISELEGLVEALKSRTDALSRQVGEKDVEIAGLSSSNAEATAREIETGSLIASLNSRIAELEENEAMLQQSLMETQEQLDIVVDHADSEIQQLSNNLRIARESLSELSSNTESEILLLKDRIVELQSSGASETGSLMAALNSRIAELEENEAMLQQSLMEKQEQLDLVVDHADSQIQQLSNDLRIARESLSELSSNTESEILLLKDRIVELQSGGGSDGTFLSEYDSFMLRISVLEESEGSLKACVEKRDAQIRLLEGRVADLLSEVDRLLEESGAQAEASRGLHVDKQELLCEVKDKDTHDDHLASTESVFTAEMDESHKSLTALLEGEAERVQEDSLVESRLMELEALLRKKKEECEVFKTEIENLNARVSGLESSSESKTTEITLLLERCENAKRSEEMLQEQYAAAARQSASLIDEIAAFERSEEAQKSSLEEKTLELDRLRSALQETDSRRLSSESEVNALAAEIASLQGHKVEMERLYEACGQQLASEQERNEVLNANIADLESFITRAEEHNQSQKGAVEEVNSLRERVRELTGDGQLHVSKMEMLAGRIIELEIKEETLQETLSEKESELGRVRELYELLQARELSFEEQNHGLQLEVEDLQERVAELEMKEQSVDEATRDKDLEIEALRERSNVLVKSGSALETLVQEKEVELQRLRNRVLEYEQIGVSEETIKGLELEVEDLRDRVIELEVAEAALQQLNNERDAQAQVLQNRIQELESQSQSVHPSDSLSAQISELTKDLDFKNEEIVLLRECVAEFESKETAWMEVAEEKDAELDVLRAKVEESDRNEAYIEDRLMQKQRDVDELESRLNEEEQKMALSNRNADHCEQCDERQKTIEGLRRRLAQSQAPNQSDLEHEFAGTGSMLQTIVELRDQVADLRSKGARTGTEVNLRDRSVVASPHGAAQDSLSGADVGWWTLDESAEKESERTRQYDASNDDVSRRIQQLESLVIEKSEAVSNLQNELDQVRRQLFRTESAVDDLDSIGANATNIRARKTLEDTIFYLREELDESNATKTALSNEIKTLAAQLGETESTRNELKELVEMLNSDRTSFQAREEEILNQLAEVSAKAENDNVDLLNVIEELKQENESLSTSLSCAPRNRNQNQERVDDSIDTFITRNEILMSENSKLKSMLERHQLTDVDAVLNRCRVLEEDKRNLVAEVALLRASSRSDDGDNGMSNGNLRKDPRLQELVRSLSDTLRHASPAAQGVLLAFESDKQSIHMELDILNQAASQLKEENQRKDLQIQSVHQTLKDVNAQKATILQELDAVKTEQSLLQHENQMLISQLSSLQSALSLAQSRPTSTRDADSEATIKSLTETVEKQRAVLAEKDLEILNLSVERDDRDLIRAGRLSPPDVSLSLFGRDEMARDAEIDKLRDQVAELTRECRALGSGSDSKAQLETALKSTKRRLEVVENEFGEARVQIEVLSERLQENDEIVRKMKAELKEKKVEVVALMVERDDLEARRFSVESLSEQLAEQTKIIAAQSQEIAELKLEIMELNQAAEASLASHLSRERDDVGNLEEALRFSQLQVDQLTSDKLRLEVKLETGAARIHELESLAQQEQESSREAAEVQSQLEARGLELASLELTVKSLEKQLADSDNVLNAVRVETERLFKENMDLHDQLTEFTAPEHAQNMPAADAKVKELAFQKSQLEVALRDAVQAAQDTILEAEQEVTLRTSSLQARVNELESSLVAVQDKEIKSTARADELEEYSTGQRSTITMLQGRCRELEMGANELIRVAEISEGRLSELETEKLRLEHALADARRSQQHASAGVDRQMMAEMEQRLRDISAERDVVSHDLGRAQAQARQSATETVILQQRVEELEAERDSFKQMMMDTIENQNVAGAAAQGAKPSGLAGLIGIAPTDKLQKQISELTRQNAELKQLEKLRPQVMDLQQQLVTAQEEVVKAQQQYLREGAMWAEEKKELTMSIHSIHEALEVRSQEAVQAKALAQQFADRVADLEVQERTLVADLLHVRRELEEARAKAVDPTVINDYEGKISELMGERKHWQKKAQSLSKDMQRMINASTDAAQLKEENGRLTLRIEELIAERTAFREAMQQTMEDVSPAQARANTAMTPISKKIGGSVFKSVVGSRGKS